MAKPAQKSMFSIVLEQIQGIKSGFIRNKILDVLLAKMIPFNRGLGLKILELNPSECRVLLPNSKRRQNHVKGAHACCLALLGEYTAGMLIAQNFSFDRYRIIIGSLSIQYKKQARAEAYAEVSAPKVWPEVHNGETWVEMETKIINREAEIIAVCQTSWQIKDWKKIRVRRSS